MPLSLNIGRSIKTSRNYNSSGYSINLTAELDNALLARPRELQAAIDQLYQQADLALERQIHNSSDQPDTSRSASSGSSPPSNTSRRQGSSTQSQRRAIEAICHDLNLDLQLVLADLGCQHFDQLNIRQASQLIDELKAHQNTPGTHISGTQPRPHPRNNTRSNPRSRNSPQSNHQNHHPSRPYPDDQPANTPWSHR